ncbi:hypothetical protein F9B85_04450 [Heliorestis acidaminivorans]|uniref:Cyclic-di-AMP phosphodiesterase n=1 Tax=Heliorestis acidaminivorans TaxID=553427 RepID=A0A6I0ETA6_9FIRM|nr:DHH family phosphoesterase [Heliorestis acidaminivorans]KAB2953865.1 hypothetical protein F9B85_04450 [Heliorestis acidaminivorans]
MFKKNRLLIWVLGFSTILLVALIITVLAYWHVGAAGIGVFVLALAGLAFLDQLYRNERHLQKKIKEMESKIELAHFELLTNLPIGLANIDAGGYLLWHNHEFARLLEREGQVLQGKIRAYLPELHFKKSSRFSELLSSRLVIGERLMKVSLYSGPRKEERILTFDDVTDLDQRVAREEGPVIGICLIDNFAEAILPLEEEDKSAVLAEIDKILGEWALSMDVFLRKFAEDRYILLMTGSSLRHCQAHNFEILDRIRTIQLENKIPITLSIGIGSAEESMVDLGRLARNAVDLALGRGGDQVVVKSVEKVHFYGGNTEAVEKRTRVRVRVVARSLKNLIYNAENVIVMGHENADLDAAGSALGLARAVTVMGKPVTVHLDSRGGALENLLHFIKKNDVLARQLVTAEEALASAGEGTLLIVVDTHKPSLLPVQSILKKVEKIAVIDHHRRGTESIEPNNLLYVEAYASSTCELVAELIQYLDEEIELGRLVSSAMLAGITVDTKNFAFMTGARTFEAASYLRRSGADPQLVQSILRDPLDTVVRRAAIVKSAEVYFETIAISVQKEQTARSAVISAQAADALLEVAGIKASFVLRTDGKGTAISARSHNEINVHAIMEHLGGGGHLTIAGAQLPDITPEEAKEKLIVAIEEYLGEHQEE